MLSLNECFHDLADVDDMVILGGIIRLVDLGVQNALRLQLADIELLADEHGIGLLKIRRLSVMTERQSGTCNFVLVSAADSAAVDKLLAVFLRQEA